MFKSEKISESYHKIKEAISTIVTNANQVIQDVIALPFAILVSSVILYNFYNGVIRWDTRSYKSPYSPRGSITKIIFSPTKIIRHYFCGFVYPQPPLDTE